MAGPRGLPLRYTRLRVRNPWRSDIANDTIVSTIAAIHRMLAVAMLIGVRPSTPDIATSGHTASTSATMAINHAQALLLIRIPSGPLKADATGVPFPAPRRGLHPAGDRR